MVALAAKGALVKAAQASSALTNAATTDAGDHLTYQVTDKTKQVFDPQATITVSVNGTPVAASLYTLNRLFGKVKFLVARAASDTVTISGQFLPLMTLVQAHQFQYQFKSAALDASTFQMTWMKRVNSLKDTHYQIDVFRESGDTFVDDLFTTTNVFMVEIWSDSSAAGPDVRGWALMTQLQEQGQIAAMQSQTITGEGTADADGRVVSNGTY